MHTLSPVFVNLVFFSLPSHIITPCVSPSEVYMRAVTSARRHSKHCTLSLVWLWCAGAASDWWGSLVVPRMRLLNAFVYVMGNGYLDSHCVSFYSNDVYRKEKKESLRKIVSFTFDLKQRGTNAMIHQFWNKGSFVHGDAKPFPSVHCCQNLYLLQRYVWMTVLVFHSQWTGNCKMDEGV